MHPTLAREVLGFSLVVSGVVRKTCYLLRPQSSGRLHQTCNNHSK